MCKYREIQPEISKAQFTVKLCDLYFTFLFKNIIFKRQLEKFNMKP